MTEIKTYKNGLRLAVKKIDGLMSVTAGIIVGAGSRYEKSETNGISHFIEHMLFKGTKTRTAFDIASQIDGIGAQINAFTTKEATCFYTKSTAEHVDESVEILADMYFNSEFSTEETDNERGVILEEINMCEDTPEDLCADLLATAHYGKTGLGRTILGTAENIKRFTKNDILEYMNEYYTADNTVLSFAGNITMEKADALVQKYFSEVKRNSDKTRFFESEKLKFATLSKRKKIEQTHISLAMKGIPYASENVEAISVINTVLGGGMSSRLFQRIREKLGLAYSVYSYVSTYRNTGSLCIYAGVNPINIDYCYETVISELNEFCKGMTVEEFLRGKEQVRGAFIMSEESTASQMLLCGKYLLFENKAFDFEHKLEAISRLTLDEVNALIPQYYTPDKMSKAVVGKNAKKL